MGNEQFTRQTCGNIWMLLLKDHVVFSCNLFNDIQLLLIKFKFYFWIKCIKLTDFSQPDLTEVFKVGGTAVLEWLMRLLNVSFDM